MIQRRGKRDDTVTGNATVGRLHPDDSAQRSRLPNGSAGVGSESAGAQRRRHRRRRATRRAAGHALEIPRIVHGLVRAVFIRRAHGELVHVELAQADGTGRSQTPGRRRFVRRNEALENLRTRRGFHAAGDEDVLETDGNPAERTNRLASRDFPIDGVGRFARAGLVHQEKAAELLVEPLDAVEVGIDQVARFPSSCGNPSRQLAQRCAAHLGRAWHGYAPPVPGTMRGTSNEPSRRRGAF